MHAEPPSKSREQPGEELNTKARKFENTKKTLGHFHSDFVFSYFRVFVLEIGIPEEYGTEMGRAAIVTPSQKSLNNL